MQEVRLDPSIVFPDRPKNAKLTRKAKCPGCLTTVKWSEFEDGDEALAANCRSYCEKENNKWYDNPLCYARNWIKDIVKVENKPKNKKKSSQYKGKKKAVKREKTSR